MSDYTNMHGAVNWTAILGEGDDYVDQLGHMEPPIVFMKRNHRNLWWLSDEVSIVYFIGQDEYVKIGMTSRSVEARIKDFRPVNPRPFEVIATLTFPHVVTRYWELFFHKYYHCFRLQGTEWFTVPSDRILTDIQKLTPFMLQSNSEIARLKEWKRNDDPDTLRILANRNEQRTRGETHMKQRSDNQIRRERAASERADELLRMTDQVKTLVDVDDSVLFWNHYHNFKKQCPKYAWEHYKQLFFDSPFFKEWTLSTTRPGVARLH